MSNLPIENIIDIMTHSAKVNGGRIDRNLSMLNKKYNSVYFKNKDHIESQFKSRKLPGFTEASETIFKQLINEWFIGGPPKLSKMDSSTVVNPLHQIVLVVDCYDENGGGQDDFEDDHVFRSGSTVKNIVDWVSSTGGNMFGFFTGFQREEHPDFKYVYRVSQEDID